MTHLLFLLNPSLVHGPDSSAWPLSSCQSQSFLLLDPKPNPEQPVGSQRWIFPHLWSLHHICTPGECTTPQDMLDYMTTQRYFTKRWRWSRLCGPLSFCFLLIQNQRSSPQAREARPQPRFSKKVFQNNCNVAAAGDPRAKLGSYSQAYGTINKTDLDNLLRSRPYNQ